VDVTFLSAYNAKNGPAAYSSAGATCSNVSCHGGQTTPGWLSGAVIDVNTQCASCHVSGTTQYDSYFSGEHTKHVVEQNIACFTCHDITLLAVNHFTKLNTTTMEGPASATISSALNFVPGVTPNTDTCTPACHGTQTW
jgi:predicted CxxxxCH...CXXCH cytochrome family protein